MFKCALVKPIGLLCQHAAEEMALNGFKGLCVCVFLSVYVCAGDSVRALTCGWFVLCLWV